MNFLALPDVVRYQICIHLDPSSLIRLSLCSKETRSKIAWKMLLKRLHEPIVQVEGMLAPPNTNEWVIPPRLLESQRASLVAVHVFMNGPFPETADHYQLFARIQSQCCMVCGKLYPALAQEYWFGRRLCRSPCLEQYRGRPLLKLIPRTDALLKYKRLKLDERDLIVFRHPTTGTVKLPTYWERQILALTSSDPGDASRSAKKRKS
jgi:hypothetical protein